MIFSLFPPPSVTGLVGGGVGGVWVVCGWCDVRFQFLCSVLHTTGPDNQRVCKCHEKSGIFKSLFMVRILKEDIFMVIVAGLFYYIFM